MRKIFHKIHLWLAVPFGLVIFVVCFTGAALVFETEIMELCHRNDYFVGKQEKEPLPIDKLMVIVAASLPDSVEVTGVTISSNPGRAYQVGLSKPRRASVYIDQYTGEIRHYHQRSSFFTFMLRMHRWLLDSMKPGQVSVGKTIVGISTLLFVFVLVTGIVIWIPRNRKALKHRLKISVRKGLKRFWYDLHVAGGIYAVILLLAMSLTGLTWSFSWYRSGFYRVFGVEVQQHGSGHGATQTGGERQAANTGTAEHGNRQQGENRSEGNRRGNRPESEVRTERGETRNRMAGEAQEGRGESSNQQQDEHRQDSRPGDHLQPNRYAVWQKVYEEVTRLNPDRKQINISGSGASVSFSRWGNQRASDRYTFDEQTGEITGSSLYRNQEKSGKIRGWIYTVHVGSWGGLFSKILTFLAALLGASLPLTGYYLWIKKSFNKSRSRKRKVAKGL